MIRVPVCSSCRSVVFGMEVDGRPTPGDPKAEIPPPLVHWSCVNLDCPARKDKGPIGVDWVFVEDIVELKDAR